MVYKIEFENGKTETCGTAHKTRRTVRDHGYHEPEQNIVIYMVCSKQSRAAGRLSFMMLRGTAQSLG